MSPLVILSGTSNGRYEWELDGVTKFLDRLPVIETDKMTSLSVEGEVAQVLPNPNSINNAATGDPNGVAFIDDFEVPSVLLPHLFSAVFGRNHRFHFFMMMI